MAYVITQTCCKDASCVAACPVNCIHPTPQERAFGNTEMLYVDPQVCIDCGACADACPVDAVKPRDLLTAAEEHFADLNAGWYAHHPQAAPRAEQPTFRLWDRPAFGWSAPRGGPLRVAVVGTGPAGMYAAEHLLLRSKARVTLIDRLPVAGGLVRFGVAPDHPDTRRVAERFARLYAHPRLDLRLGVEIGAAAAVGVADLARDYDAVVYAVGAAEGRVVDVPGAGLPGSSAATDFVRWYNAHPEAPADAYRLDDVERAVVVGTGNVAVDVARLLTSDTGRLARTDIAAHALTALRASTIREVVLLGRRGPAHAAFTLPELAELGHLPGVELVVDDHDPRVAAELADAADAKTRALAALPRLRTDRAAPPAAGRRIVLRFHATPKEITGDACVRGVRLDDGTEVAGQLVLSAIGHRGTAVPGLPADPATGVVTNTGGRVAGVPGAYVVGWAKRGPHGGIGDNRHDAEETVRALLDDAAAGVR